MPSLDPPVPVSATFNPGPNTVFIVFDKPLVAGAIDVNPWFVRWMNTLRLVVNALIFDSTVVLVTTTPFADLGPDVVSFNPPPFDVVSDFGFVEAPAFNDFPLV